MKTKKYQRKQNKLKSQISDLSIDQSLLSQVDSLKSKPHQIKLDPTITSFSQNQISTGSLSTKNFRSVLNDEEIAEQITHHKKSRKSNKKKFIEKNLILRSRDRHGKSSRILRNKEALKLKLKQKKAQKLKLAAKLNQIKQIIIPTTIKPAQTKPKVSKTSIIDKKLEKVKLDECADIKMIGFDRKQLQKKRDDLLKRIVDDWNFVQKLRSDKRELRTLTIY